MAMSPTSKAPVKSWLEDVSLSRDFKKKKTCEVCLLEDSQTIRIHRYLLNLKHIYCRIQVSTGFLTLRKIRLIKPY